jgi:translation initiation factor IF-3
MDQKIQEQIMEEISLNQKVVVANHDIKIPRVIVINSQGEKLGEFLIKDAIKIAENDGLDLVLVGSGDKPVCKIMDLGKFLYEQKKQEKLKKTNSKTVDVKEIKFGLQTEQGYIDLKSNQARKFLERGDKVKVTINFRGRESSHINIMREKCIDFFKSLEDIAQVESPPKVGGDNVNMILIKKI